MGDPLPLSRLIRQRRSIRAYADRPVEESKLSAIIEAARLAPSACNAQGWRFVVVDRKELIAEIVGKGMGAPVANAWAGQAPIIIAGCFHKNIITHRLAAGIKKIDYSLLDMGIAGEHMVLQAEELGLGTCWIGWFKARTVRKILEIPRNVNVVFLLSVGYPADGQSRERKRLSVPEIAFRNRYGSSFNSIVE